MQEDLLSLLWELCQRIQSHGGVLKGDSLFERYDYFVKNSSSGKDCQYAKKCQALILKHDYDDIMKLFLKVLEQYRLVEGNNFGKDS